MWRLGCRSTLARRTWWTTAGSFGPEKFRWVYRWVFRRHPAMVQALDRRHQVYNQALEQLRQLEGEGRALVIAPKESLGLSRFEKNRERLLAAYREGLEQTKGQMGEILSFCQGR